MSRRVSVVTATRAEYGLLRPLLREISSAPDLTLQLVVTGTHLEARFGSTVRDIERDGFRPDAAVPLEMHGDTPVDVSRSMALALSGIAEQLQTLRPDVVVLLGDRFEILAAASAATICGVPIAHIHGGELTEGAFDDAMRHAITKLSHLHFVAAEEYGRRVVQLGEDPARVFVVGGMGVDAIAGAALLEREALEEALDFRFGPRNLLITFHPETLDNRPAEQMNELLAALDPLDPETGLLFTMPNADPGNRLVFEAIEAFVARRPGAKAYASLGSDRYLSCLRVVDGVVGNSSSGLLEAPTFRTGTVNIGGRQRGRVKAASVIDCEPDRASISAALAKLFSAPFRATLPGVVNPYGEAGASARIVRVLQTQPLAPLLKKSFHDVVC